MKKYLFILVAAMGLVMTGCKSVNVEPAYAAAAKADIRPQFEVGNQVTVTVHYKKLGPLVFKADFDTKKSISFASVSVNSRKRFKDPLANLRGAIMYKAVEGTQYDLILAPMFTIECNGIDYTVTMKGYGAKCKGVHQNMGAR